MGFLDRLRGQAAFTPTAAAEELERGTLLLVDVRGADEYRAGHVPGAVHLPLDQVVRSLDRLAGQGQDVAFICKSGLRSRTATKAAAAGGTAARNVSGGMLAWQRSGLPIEPGKGKQFR